MIKDQKLWKQFERDMIKKEELSLEQKYKILNAMLQEALRLGVLPLDNPLEGIEVDIRIARIVNAVGRSVVHLHKKIDLVEDFRIVLPTRKI